MMDVRIDRLRGDEKIDATAYDPNRAGCYIGSGVGGVGTLVDAENVRLEKGQNRISPLAVPMILNDSTPGAVSIQHGLKGPNMSMVSACASAAACRPSPPPPNVPAASSWARVWCRSPTTTR